MFNLILALIVLVLVAGPCLLTAADAAPIARD